MVTTNFLIDVSYSQISVFWSSLQQPFNDWTQRHVDQGFVWRKGSVSFRTLVEYGSHLVQLDIVDHAGSVSADVFRAIEVPFEVPSEGNIEIASISDFMPLTLPPGDYSLRCEFFGYSNEGVQLMRLVFAKEDVPCFNVLRSDDELTLGQELLTSAEAAIS